jgi:hypothetical protein
MLRFAGYFFLCGSGLIPPWSRRSTGGLFASPRDLVTLSVDMSPWVLSCPWLLTSTESVSLNISCRTSATAHHALEKTMVVDDFLQCCPHFQPGLSVQNLKAEILWRVGDRASASSQGWLKAGHLLVYIIENSLGIEMGQGGEETREWHLYHRSTLLWRLGALYIALYITTSSGQSAIEVSAFNSKCPRA